MTLSEMFSKAADVIKKQKHIQRRTYEGDFGVCAIGACNLVTKGTARAPYDYDFGGDRQRQIVALELSREVLGLQLHAFNDRARDKRQVERALRKLARVAKERGL